MRLLKMGIRGRKKLIEERDVVRVSEITVYVDGMSVVCQ